MYEVKKYSRKKMDIKPGYLIQFNGLSWQMTRNNMNCDDFYKITEVSKYSCWRRYKYCEKCPGKISTETLKFCPQDLKIRYNGFWIKEDKFNERKQRLLSVS